MDPVSHILGMTAPPPPGRVIGRTRRDRPLVAYRLGRGPARVSVIAGCHADEPVGPRFARSLVAYLSEGKDRDAWLDRATWWIVPDANPDGAAANAAWIRSIGDAADLDAYLRHVVRELPGDDVEFGFPRSPTDGGARPETRAIHAWWSDDDTPFAMHASLHGMAFAGGPWFLLDPAWVERSAPLRRTLSGLAAELGYALHDVERHGDKGFVRIERGFCTRPRASAMAAHFHAAGDPESAARFRPGSFEVVREWGGDPLTIVSELPLFVTPGVGDAVGPPDPEAIAWRERIDAWRARVSADASTRVGEEAREAGLVPMPVRDQLRLMGAFLFAGLSLTGA